MCEDRALRLKKGPNARLTRLYQLRYRARILQLQQASAPPQTAASTSTSQPSASPSSSSPSPVPESSNMALERVSTSNIQGGLTRCAELVCSQLPASVRARNEGLIDIALRTVVLMRRNQVLQRKLAALQAETREFIDSVMNNPENRLKPYKPESGPSPQAGSSSSSNSSSSSSSETMKEPTTSKDGQE